MKNLLILQLFTVIITLVILFALMFDKNAERSQDDKICMPSNELYDLLVVEFNENIEFVTQGFDQLSWSFLTFNSQSGTWTWVAVDSKGQACVEQAGTDGYLVSEKNRNLLNLQFSN